MTALILLPGLDGTATQHADFLGAVGDAFDDARVIAYPAQQKLGYAELEALVRAALPATEPFVLLGESFSGPIALAIAANPPEHLAGVVLSTSFAERPIGRAGLLSPLLRLAPARAAPVALLAWWLLGRWSTPALRDALRAALRRVSPAVLTFRAAAALRVRATGLANIRVPVLCLRARQDRLITAQAAEHLRASLSDCSIVDIDGPHLLLQAAPRECAQAVIAFSKRLAGFRALAARGHAGSKP